MHNRKEFFKRAEKKEQELRQQLQNEEGIDKKDFFAMTISALLVFMPVCILLLGGLALLVLWLFGAI